MAFQGTSSTQHQVEQLFELEGSQIVGSRVKAPFAINPVVYVLPMDNVLATKVYIPLRTLLVLSNVEPNWVLGYWCRYLCPIRFTR